MTQWKPTDGLNRAIATVVALENALIGMNHDVGPVLRWRMTQIVAMALDDALQFGPYDKAQPELPIRDTVSEGDVPDFGYPPNGTYTSPGIPYTAVATPQEIVANIKGAQKAQKRGRGRPKGAKGRKAKAGKTVAPEAAGEAPA